MAITPIGTSAAVHSTTGSVTGSWGTGQTRTAENLLVAVVSAAASTSVTATATSSGWTKQQEFFNTGSGPHVLVALWTTVANGADAAPTFTSTEVGTAGGMDCMLFELQGAAGALPMDAIGSYASGATTGTLAMTATTSTNVTTGGEFALAIFAQEAAAASLTWADSGTGGFTKILNGNGVSTVLQTYVGFVDNPTSGATLNDAGQFSVNTTAYGAGMVYAFQLPVPSGVTLPVEAFVNNGAATVTTGGTGTPAAGTPESWTVNTTSAFPVASGAYQFHVCDPALPREKFLVTVAPGGTGASQSWTVKRGAEGSPVLAHTAGFAIVQVVTAGVLAGLNSLGVISANSLGADPTGTNDSTAAIQSAITTLVNAGVGGVVTLGPGNYRVNGNITYNSSTPIFIQGAGLQATTIVYYGTGDCFRIYNSSTFGTGKYGGGISGLTIDGTSAGAASSGLHMGDILQYRVDIAVQNFTLAGSKGVWFDNRYYWAEQMTARIVCNNNTQNIVFDVSAGGAATATGSYERGTFDFWITAANPLQDGLVLQNGAFFDDNTVTLGGNFTSSSSALTSAVIRITGNGTGSQAGNYSHISKSALYIGVECLYIVGTNAPYTINFGSGSNYIVDCVGYVDFASNQAFQACNTPGAFKFFGPVFGDAGLQGNVVSSGLFGFPGGIWFGNYAAATTVTTGATITTARSYVAVTSTSAVTGLILALNSNFDGQMITVANTGAFPVTFAAAGTSHVVNGANCTIPAGMSQTFWFTYGPSLWYPEGLARWTALLAATFTGASSASAQNVTGLLAVLPVGTYKFHAYLPYQSAQAAGTVTFGFTFSGTAGTGTIISWVQHLAAATASTAITSATITTASHVSATMVATAGAWEEAWGTIAVTAAGTLQLQETQSVAADLCQVLAGAFIEFEQTA